MTYTALGGSGYAGADCGKKRGKDEIRGGWESGTYAVAVACPLCSCELSPCRSGKVNEAGVLGG